MLIRVTFTISQVPTNYNNNINYSQNVFYLPAYPTFEVVQIHYLKCAFGTTSWDDGTCDKIYRIDFSICAEFKTEKN